MTSSVTRLWDQYRAINPNAPADAPISFHFCDNQADADLCASLVATGQKRATAPSVAELELAGDPIPRVGDYAIVTDWRGNAIAVIQTVSVEIKKFGDIDEEFARSEGEGDLTLEWWRAAHQAYYENVLTGSKYRVDDDLEIACESFEVALKA
ncbi:MAG: ASCH domain-containing protein [Alphaproteobacteria bacterium]|nr:MAG: ASCH domain-containing protein [Alphaproteobacteria bacterium]